MIEAQKIFPIRKRRIMSEEYAIMSIDIIAAPVRARPKGGQIPKRTVCNRQEDHVRRT